MGRNLQLPKKNLSFCTSKLMYWTVGKAGLTYPLTAARVMTMFCRSVSCSGDRRVFLLPDFTVFKCYSSQSSCFLFQCYFGLALLCSLMSLAFCLCRSSSEDSLHPVCYHKGACSPHPASSCPNATAHIPDIMVLLLASLQGGASVISCTWRPG